MLHGLSLAGLQLEQHRPTPRQRRRNSVIMFNGVLKQLFGHLQSTRYIPVMEQQSNFAQGSNLVKPVLVSSSTVGETADLKAEASSAGLLNSAIDFDDSISKADDVCYEISARSLAPRW